MPEQEAAKMAPVPSPAVVMNPPVPPPDKPKVVDLTEDSSSKEDDLQRAIAMSLQEGGSVSTATSTGSAMGPPGVSQEDQDVSRALEASLLDNSGTRRKKEPPVATVTWGLSARKMSITTSRKLVRPAIVVVRSSERRGTSRKSPMVWRPRSVTSVATVSRLPQS